MKKKAEFSRLTFDFPNTLKNEFKAVCILKGVTMRSEILRLISEHLQTSAARKQSKKAMKCLERLNP